MILGTTGCSMQFTPPVGEHVVGCGSAFEVHAANYHTDRPRLLSTDSDQPLITPCLSQPLSSANEKQGRIRDFNLTTLRIGIKSRTERCLLAGTRIRSRITLANVCRLKAKIRVCFGEWLVGEKLEEKVSLHFFWL